MRWEEQEHEEESRLHGQIEMQRPGSAHTQPGLDHQQDGKGEQQDGGDETGRMVGKNVETQPADRDSEQNQETEEIEEDVFAACHISSIPGMCRIHIALSMEANLIATITARA